MNNSRKGKTLFKGYLRAR